MWKSIIFLTYLSAIVKSVIVVPGNCPDVPALVNIDREKILGRWYCVKYFPNQFEDDLKCLTDNVKVFDENKFEGVFTSINKMSGKKLEYSHHATYKVNSSIADFTFNTHIGETIITMDVKIVDTDYGNYIIGWSCNEIDSNSYRYAWIQTRTNTISDELFAKLTKIFDKYNLDSSKLADINHDDC